MWACEEGRSNIGRCLSGSGGVKVAKCCVCGQKSERKPRFFSPLTAVGEHEVIDAPFGLDIVLALEDPDGLRWHDLPKCVWVRYMVR